MKAKTVTEYLKEVCYTTPDYVPSDFALEFVNFIKLVNGNEGEENKTPIIHYKILDTIDNGDNNIANMIFRGAAKTTLMGEYLFLYLACFGKLPNFGKINLAIYVSDSIDNGVKSMRKNLEYRWENSDFLRKYIPEIKFTDIRWQFNNIDGNTFVVKAYGSKALPLTAKLYTDTGFTTIGACSVGDRIYSPEGELYTITAKSEIFNKPMYRIHLRDGRSIDVSDDHINSVVINTNPNNKARYEDYDISTMELLKQKFQHVKPAVNTRTGKKYLSNKDLIFIRNTAPIQYGTKNLPIDPYTLGLLLGDGSLRKTGSNVLHAHKDDMAFYVQHIPYKLGKPYIDKRNPNVVSQSILNIYKEIKELNLQGHGDTKFIPLVYQRGDINQRLSLLQGLIDTDGTIVNNGRCQFSSNSYQLCAGVAELVRSLGGTAYMTKISPIHHKVEFTLEMPCVRLPRKVAKLKERERYRNMVGISHIEEIPSVPSQCISIDSPSNQYLTDNYVRTHNTGLRGTKEMGKRPQLAVLDDLVSDDDARSPTVLEAIKATVYKAVDYALHPSRNKKIWLGTPFNANDPLYEAVESGAWTVNVFPVCEKFPCSREEFKGAWEDRFTYEYVEKKYNDAFKAGKVDTFYQELMLQILSDDTRLITDSDIKWYSRKALLENRSNFNFYITTDFATSEKQFSDFSFISVWAINNKGFKYWVDGICKRQTMDKNLDDLFKFCQMYQPQSVGIEVTGQQGGFIPWIEQEMMRRNIFFSLASDSNNGNAGIRPSTNKLQRFNVVVPYFKMGEVFFPQELQGHEALSELLVELELATIGGFKSKHDDALDTVSMLALMPIWLPNSPTPYMDNSGIWGSTVTVEELAISSYLV